MFGWLTRLFRRPEEVVLTQNRDPITRLNPLINISEVLKKIDTDYDSAQSDQRSIDSYAREFAEKKIGAKIADKTWNNPLIKANWIARYNASVK